MDREELSGRVDALVARIQMLRTSLSAAEKREKEVCESISAEEERIDCLEREIDSLKDDLQRALDEESYSDDDYDYDDDDDRDEDDDDD